MFLIGKALATIVVGLLVSISLWVTCTFLISRNYSKFRLELKHHIYGFVVAVITFGLYCMMSFFSGTISGIESVFWSLKETLSKQITISNGNLIDLNQKVQATLTNNSELKKYSRYIDFSKVDETNLAKSDKNIESKDIIDNLFDQYIKTFTKKLNRIWWVLFILLIITQLFYWISMINSAEKKTKFRSQNISDVLSMYD